MALPGFNSTTIRDGYTVTPQSTPSTEKVTIIGMALDGPVDTPIKVSSYSQAEKLFGPVAYKDGYLDPVTSTESLAGAGNSLVLAAWEAFNAGCGNMELVRVGGTLATSAATFGASVTITAVYPGRIYNAATLTVTTGSPYTVAITQATQKGGNFSITIPSTKTVAEFCQTINAHASNGTFRLTVPSAMASTLVSAMTSGVATLAGGQNGTRAPGELYASSITNLVTGMTAAAGTFALLGDLETNNVLLAGLYADDVYGTTAESLAQVLGEFVYNITKENYPAVGFIGVRPTFANTPVAYKTWAEGNWAATTSGNYGDASNKTLKLGYVLANTLSYTDTDESAIVDVGRSLAICAGDVVGYHKALGNYVNNFAAFAAGLCSATPVNKGLTNKELNGVQGVLTTLPKSTMTTLIDGIGRNATTGEAGGGAYMLVKPDTDTGRVRIVQDVTASKRASDFNGLQTMRITNLVVRTVQNVLKPFIGAPYKTETLASMDTNVEAALNSLNEMGCLQGARGPGQGFDFSLSPVGDGSYTDIVVDLMIKPVSQIRSIRLLISVN